MEKWKQVAHKFIDICSFKDDIDAVFLSGSHASGNADEFSDIDLYIVLNDEVKWRERGNKRIDGLYVEYFANPMRQIMKYIDDSYPNVQLIEINMILSGIVILDKNSTAQKAIDYCKQKAMFGFPKMDAYSVKMGLYTLWTNYDELSRACSYQTPDAAMHFYGFIQNAFELYSRYICSPVPHYHKLHRWLTDEGYAKRYDLGVYNDLDFLEMLKMAFKVKETGDMFDLSKEIYAYVTGKMGGIDVENFMLHGPCD